MNPRQAGAEALPGGDRCPRDPGARSRCRPYERDTKSTMTEPIRFQLDGREVEARPGETIWQVAHRHGIEIPHLCGCRSPATGRRQLPRLHGRDRGRAGARRLVHPPPDAGMKVHDRRRAGRRPRASWCSSCSSPTSRRAGRRARPDSPFWHWAERDRCRDSRFPARDARRRRRPQPSGDGGAARRLHPVQSVRPRLPRGAGQRRDRHGRPRPPRKDRVRLRRPDGALDLRRLRRVRPGLPDRRADAGKTLVDEDGVFANAPEREVDSVCPYCGVGCQLTYQIKDDRIVAVQGRDGPGQPQPAVRQGPLRLRLRPPPAPADRAADPASDGVAQARRRHRPRQSLHAFPRGDLGGGARPRGAAACGASATPGGGDALAGFGSAKGSNEEAYLFQKLVRTGFGTNNVDHCTRLCHASSVAALMEGIGSGAVTAPFTAAADADVIVVIGANPTENHPVAATFFKQAAKRGAKLDRHGPARPGAGAVRDAHAAVQARPRRRDAERDDAHDHRGGALRPAVRPGAHGGFRARSRST